MKYALHYSRSAASATTTIPMTKRDLLHFISDLLASENAKELTLKIEVVKNA